MAETAAVLRLSILPASRPFTKEPFRCASSSFGRLPSAPQRFRSTIAGSFKPYGSSDEDFGCYPWENSDAAESSIQLVTGERLTLFTSDGLIQIGGNLIPRREVRKQVKGGKMGSSRSQRYQEKNYMDPGQMLCLGALFDIAATNGLDSSRRLCIFGFCRSIEMLCDVVEDTVREHGGEVVAAEKGGEVGLQEKLSMSVAVPLLWGVPPASETLRFAVKSGGGIVDKVYWQWDFL
ncbi:hypothetical protein M569_15707 [Genlisea aurea]|uniref:DUF7811 domain-containing protein n=1 Tax=Genlisea aurea TaxID=192259 RepID=S8D8S6_9LAMI|nr:hypothetical protein M569_15707 [Genlisea aurea]